LYGSYLLIANWLSASKAQRVDPAVGADLYMARRSARCYSRCGVDDRWLITRLWRGRVQPAIYCRTSTDDNGRATSVVGGRSTPLITPPAAVSIRPRTRQDGASTAKNELKSGGWTESTAGTSLFTRSSRQTSTTRQDHDQLLIRLCNCHRCCGSGIPRWDKSHSYGNNRTTFKFRKFLMIYRDLKTPVWNNRNENNCSDDKHQQRLNRFQFPLICHTAIITGPTCSKNTIFRSSAVVSSFLYWRTKKIRLYFDNSNLSVPTGTWQKSITTFRDDNVAIFRPLAHPHARPCKSAILV